MRWIKKQLVSNLTLLTPKFPRYVTNATESIPQNGAHIFRKIVKTTKMRGFGQPSFLMQIFFRIFRMDFFCFKKGRVSESERDRILTHFCLPFSCINPTSRSTMASQRTQGPWAEAAATLSCGRLAQTTDVWSLKIEFNKNIFFVTESFRNHISPGTRNARVISQPGDGSCLYHSISFGLGGWSICHERMNRWTELSFCWFVYLCGLFG